VKWNDGLLSYSLEASKTTVGFVVNKVTIAKPPAKVVVEPPVNQGLLRKGFLNPHPSVTVTLALLREVNNVEVVGPTSPSSGCIILSSVEGNGFSQPRDWHVGFDHTGEIVVWEEDVDFLDGLPLDWALDCAFGEEALAIRDAMEEEFQRDKMIAC
jgi:hypothetical protein